MTQHEKSQSTGVLMIVVFSAMLLWALTAVVWPVPVVYADDPEIITITVTSNLETYFYDPGLDPAGGTVYFNSVGGEEAGQVLTVTVTCSGTVQTFEGAPAFGDLPPTDFSAPWQVIYTVEAGAGTQSGIVFTVTNAMSETDTAVITFTQDNTDPTVISPTIIEGSLYLHADGLTVYYGDDMGVSPRTFRVQGNAQDNGVGLHYVAYSAALNQGDSQDSTHLESWYRDYTANRYNIQSGVITATVYDRVGNFATQTFNYIRDSVNPNISDPFIAENSPYLHANGTTVYYSDQMDGTAQSFTVQGNAADNGAGAGLYRATFSYAFGSSPGSDYTPSEWSGDYYVESSDWGSGTITVTAYDNVRNWSEQIFNYIEDTTNPTVILTYVTPPGYDEDNPDDYLDADGSNWYNAGDFTAGGEWEFHYNTVDDGAGLASGSAFWHHSNDLDDQQIPELDLDGDDVFNGVDDDGDGVVTVTLTITDNVGNLDSATVVFNIDNTEPAITLPSIEDYGSPWLHVDGSTVYYGNMTAPQSFRVQGEANDNGVGLHYAEFSSALGGTPDKDYSPEEWAGIYTADSGDIYTGVITVTVYDLLGNDTYENFYYIQDIAPPEVNVDCPAVSSEPYWTVSWRDSYDRPPDASGLDHFNVYYKVESGGWQGWLAETSKIEATFGPTSPVTVKDGETYYFQVEAKDNVSNDQYSNECATTYSPGVKGVFLPIIMKSCCPDTSPCDWDIYEPNNFMCSAYPISSSVCIESYICSSLDRSDYYSIEITTLNAIRIDLTSLPANADYDLYLYDSPPLSKLIASSAERKQRPETITYHPTHMGIYYVRVYPYSGYSDTDSYELCVIFD